MSENKYEVIEVHLKAVSYSLLIFKISEDDVDDKLTYFTREKGLIAKSLFDDFLIATCVSNITDFLQHLTQRGTGVDHLSKIRAEVVEEILKINPLLIPSALVINSNRVVKIKRAGQCKGEKLLTDNDIWNKDVYKEGAEAATKTLDKSRISNVKDLDYTSVQKFWRRLGQYIIIKQFEPGSELVILGDRSFATRSAFEQYVVTICVKEIEDLFMRLDKMGLPQRVEASKLISELYEICRKSNPFLDFDLYQEDTAKGGVGAIDPFESFQQHAAQNSPDEVLSEALKEKKDIKLFRDIKKGALLNLAKAIKKDVVGQSEPIDDLVDAIQRASVGLKSPDQPIGSFLFTGYSGIGKTYTAKILAEKLTGSRHNLVTIDCSEYAADHEYAKLIGAPSGYIGHEQGGYLTNAVKNKPFSIILFDEIEKASDKVHQLLLQIMDEARLMDGRGHRVSFRDTIVIMTSNLGVKEIRAISKTIGFGKASELTKGKRVDAIKAALKKKFKPEFLNRITAMINFDGLTKKHYLNIIGLELAKLKKNLKINRTEYSKLKVVFDKSLNKYIYAAGVDEKFGARPLQRAIEREISTPLARKLLRGDIKCDNTKVTVLIEDGKVAIKTEQIEQIDAPPFYMVADSRDE